MVDRPRSACAVCAFREGAFSAVGHDLKLQVTDFTLEIGEGLAVTASCRTDSLRAVEVKPEVVVEVSAALPPANAAGEARS